VEQRIAFREIAIGIEDLVGEKMGIVAIEEFRIIGDDRAIEVIARALLIEVIGLGGIKDGVEIQLLEFRDVAVHEFSGVADRIASDGALAFIVEITGAFRRKHHLNVQPLKEGFPEGILLDIGKA
jgi:hypothetical protein